MISKKLFPSVVTLVVLFLMSSCTQNEFIENNDNDKSAIANHFKILPLTNNQVRNTKYTTNYQVELESSEFNIENDVMQLEIPIPLGDFSFLKAYNVSTANNVAILYVIQKEKQNVVIDLPTKFVIQDQLALSDLNIDTALLSKNGCLRVYVMNNSETDMANDEDEILNCLIDSLDNYTCEDRYAFPENCANNKSDNSKRPGTLGGGIIR